MDSVVYTPSEVIDGDLSLKPRLTFKENIAKLMTEQDSSQRMAYIFIVAMEIYRCLVSSLLILFVPQLCGDHACTYQENVEVTGTLAEKRLYIAGLFFNFTLLATFIILFMIEVIREERLIKYLEVNPKVKSDNASVGSVLKLLAADERHSLRTIQMAYKVVSRMCTALFVVNTIISGIILHQYSAGNQTNSTFVTNILFMVTKIYEVYNSTAAEKNIFYSAFLKSKIQYNALDPDEKGTCKVLGYLRLTVITILSPLKQATRKCSSCSLPNPSKNLLLTKKKLS